MNLVAENVARGSTPENGPTKPDIELIRLRTEERKLILEIKKQKDEVFRQQAEVRKQKAEV